MAEGEVVEVAWRAISSVVMTTSSRSVLPGMAIEPWTIPTCHVRRGPSAARTSRSRSGLCGARLVREDRAVDDDVEGRQVDAGGPA